MDSTTLGVLLLTASCLVPLAVGFVLGIAYQNRYTALGLPWALVPDFICKYIERYQ